MNHTLELFAYANMPPNAQPFPDNPEYRDAMRSAVAQSRKAAGKAKRGGKGDPWEVHRCTR